MIVISDDQELLQVLLDTLGLTDLSRPTIQLRKLRPRLDPQRAC